MPNAEADARYAQELAARALDEVQLDAYWRPWSIRMPDGEWREIGPPHVESDGYLTWRWHQCSFEMARRREPPSV